MIDAGSVVGCVLKMARLDAFIATTVSTLRGDGSDNAGGQQQLFYNSLCLFYKQSSVTRLSD